MVAKESAALNAKFQEDVSALRAKHNSTVKEFETLEGEHEDLQKQHQEQYDLLNQQVEVLTKENEELKQEVDELKHLRQADPNETVSVTASEEESRLASQLTKDNQELQNSLQNYKVRYEELKQEHSKLETKLQESELTAIERKKERELDQETRRENLKKQTDILLTPTTPAPRPRGSRDSLAWTPSVDTPAEQTKTVEEFEDRMIQLELEKTQLETNLNNIQIELTESIVAKEDFAKQCAELTLQLSEASASVSESEASSSAHQAMVTALADMEAKAVSAEAARGHLETMLEQAQQHSDSRFEQVHQDLQQLQVDLEQKENDYEEVRRSLVQSNDELAETCIGLEVAKSDVTRLERATEKQETKLQSTLTQLKQSQEAKDQLQIELENTKIQLAEKETDLNQSASQLSESSSDTSQLQTRLKQAEEAQIQTMNELEIVNKKLQQAREQHDQTHHLNLELRTTLQNLTKENENNFTELSKAQQETLRLRGVAAEALEQEQLVDKLQRSLELVTQARAEESKTQVEIRNRLLNFAQHHHDLGLALELTQLSQIDNEISDQDKQTASQHDQQNISNLLNTTSSILTSYSVLQKEHKHAVAELQRASVEHQKRVQKLQADGRSGVAKEEEMMVVLANTRLQLAETEEYNSQLKAQVINLRDSNESEELRVKLTELTSRLVGYESLLEEKMSDKVRIEEDQARLVKQLNLQLTGHHQETQRLREHLVNVEASHRVMEQEVRAEAEELLGRIRDYELDAEAMKSLAGDFSKLQKEHNYLQAEVQQKTLAINNLQNVLQSFEQDKEVALATRDQELTQLKEVVSAGREASERYEQLLREQEQGKTNQEELQQQLRATQGYVVRLEADNSKLRRGLQHTMEEVKRFSNSNNQDNTLVDRRLVVATLVAYFERPAHQKQEVMEVMARILQLDQDEKHRMGLGPKKGLTGAIKSWATWLSPWDPNDAPLPGPDPNAGPENLADLWVDFLLKETGEEPSASNPVGAPSPLSSAPVTQAETVSAVPNSYINNNTTVSETNQTALSVPTPVEVNNKFEISPTPSTPSRTLTSNNNLGGMSTLASPATPAHVSEARAGSAASASSESSRTVTSSPSPVPSPAALSQTNQKLTI